MGDRLSADNSFFSSAESIKSNGVLPSRLSRMTLLIWQQTSRVSSTLSLFRLVPFGMILLINLWLFSTWGVCHDAWGSQKNTWVRINPGRVCSKALGFLNSTPLSVRITPKSLLRCTNDSFRTTLASGCKTTMNTHLGTKSVALATRPVNTVVFAHNRGSACEASIMQNFTGNSGSRTIKVSSNRGERIVLMKHSLNNITFR